MSALRVERAEGLVGDVARKRHPLPKCLRRRQRRLERRHQPQVGRRPGDREPHRNVRPQSAVRPRRTAHPRPFDAPHARRTAPPRRRRPARLRRPARHPDPTIGPHAIRTRTHRKLAATETPRRSANPRPITAVASGASPWSGIVLSSTAWVSPWRYGLRRSAARSNASRCTRSGSDRYVGSSSTSVCSEVMHETTVGQRRSSTQTAPSERHSGASTTSTGASCTCRRLNSRHTAAACSRLCGALSGAAPGNAAQRVQSHADHVDPVQRRHRRQREVGHKCTR